MASSYYQRATSRATTGVSSPARWQRRIAARRQPRAASRRPIAA